MRTEAYAPRVPLGNEEGGGATGFVCEKYGE